MYSIMIVDDELHAVEGVKSGVHWDLLEVTNVFTAHNIRQAKEIFDHHSIDIILCDIEMPQGSGIDLLTWVREFYPKTECIFLTCHADFTFAKQALQLGSLDYILKPIPFIELEEVILKAIEKINREKELEQGCKYGQYWVKNQPLLIERFWQDILSGTIGSNPTSIMAAASERNINFYTDQLVLPILVSIEDWLKNLSHDEEKSFEDVLKIAGEEVFGIKDEQKGLIIRPKKHQLMVLLFLTKSDDYNFKDIQKMCESYIDSCYRFFHCYLSCYIGSISSAQDLVTVIDQLDELDRNNVAGSNKVFLINEIMKISSTSKLPDMNVWSVLLLEGNNKKVISEARTELDKMACEGIDASKLTDFYHNFQQMVYYTLKQKGIQAHQIFNDKQSLEISHNACKSIKDLVKWITHSVMKVEEFSNNNKSDTVLEKAIKYITVNIDQNISREDIANEVFLNPDYLSRIFKKETGFSITEYLLNERMKISRELLVKTDMSVSTIATYVGYNNFSYFSKIFKKQYCMTPIEYRDKTLNKSS